MVISSPLRQMTSDGIPSSEAEERTRETLGTRSQRQGYVKKRLLKVVMQCFK